MAIKYYSPSYMLTNYFEKELHNLKMKEPGHSVGVNKTNRYIRNNPKQNNIARNKHSIVEHIFQCFADILYFFEKIEDNYEKLNPMFEEDLRDLVGFNESYIIDEFKDNPESFQPSYYQNPGGPLARLVSSILLLNPDSSKIKKTDVSDFRTAVALYLFQNSLQSLLDRTEDLDFRNAMRYDIQKLNFFTKMLAKQMKDESGYARRGIGYVQYRYPVTN